MNLNPLLKLIDGLKSLDSKAEVEKIIIDNRERLTELMQEQLSAGKDISGNKRIDSYAPLTKFLKNKYGSGLGAVTDRVTFFMTGELYGSLHAQVENNSYRITSPLPTFGKMIDRVGDEDYGLNPQGRLEFATTVTLPEFSKVLEEKTGLKI